VSVPLERVETAGRVLSLRRFAAPSSEWTVVALHGVMSHSGWLAPLGEALAERHIGVLALDRRGSGAAPVATGGDDPDAWIADVEAALSLARTGSQKVALLGWCWGARLAVVAASRTEVDRLVLAAPGLVMAPAVETRARETALHATGPELPFPFAEEDFSDSPHVRDFIRQDEWRWRTQSRSFTQASRAILERALAAAPALDVPTLAIFAREDRIVDNERTRARLGRSLHRTLSGGHALVLENTLALAGELADWLVSDPKAEEGADSATES
jgi:pimeloyl-ACP methyl ester carboxylesterase